MADDADRIEDLNAHLAQRRRTHTAEDGGISFFSCDLGRRRPDTHEVTIVARFAPMWLELGWETAGVGEVVNGKVKLIWTKRGEPVRPKRPGDR